MLFVSIAKIFIAFGLLNLKETRIPMKLTTFLDRHAAAKLIYIAFKNILILENRNRFHHFEDGKFTCNEITGALSYINKHSRESHSHSEK